MRYILNLVVLVTFLFSNFGLGYAFDTTAKTSMLRQSSANSRLETTVAAIGVELLQSTFSQGGAKALKALLSDRAIDGVEDPIEQALIKDNVAVVESKGKAFVVGLIGNGWRLDLSEPTAQPKPFASVEELQDFISGGQLTWIAGEYTPAQLIDAQAEAKSYLRKAGDENRIFSQVRPEGIDVASLPPNKIPKGGKLTVGGNWKLRPFENEDAARAKAREFKNKFVNIDPDAEIVIFVDKKWAKAISEELKGTNIHVGAQSFFFDPAGDLQEQINQAVGLGFEYAMVGHSMHRFPDAKVLPGVKALTNEGANKILKAIVQDSRLKPWYVIGVDELPDVEFSDSPQQTFIKQQINDAINLGLDGVTANQLARFIITAEPIRDISTKAGDGVIDPKTRVNFPKVDLLANLLSEALKNKIGTVAEQLNTGYGASASPDTAKILLSHKQVFNILPGGKSLEADDFYPTVVNAIRGKYGSKDNIKDNISEQVARYSATRTSVARQLPPLGKKEQKALVARLRPAFDFIGQAINSVDEKDVILAMRRRKDMPYPDYLPALGQLKDDLDRVRQAIVLDEDDNPSFFYKGEVGSSKFLAVTASSGGYRYAGYDYEQAGQTPPRSIYNDLAMIESYMEMAKTDPEALRAYRLKSILHEYSDVSGGYETLHNIPQEAVDIINKYDRMALDMWKAREAKKAAEKLAKENKKVLMEATIANIAKFLDPKLEEVIPNELIEVAKQELQNLVTSGLLTDYQVKANAGDMGIISTRQNKNAVEDDALIPAAIVNALLKVLDKAKEMGIYKAEDLSEKSYLEQARALEIRRPYVPFKYSERAADPFGVFWASNTYVGAFNLLILQIFTDPMYNAGETIDPTMPPFIFEVWDLVKDTITRVNGETEGKKLIALANQPGRYAIVAAYAIEGWAKVPADEPVVIVTVKRMADDGKSPVGDFSPIMIARAQSGLPAWGELLAPVGTAMPVITYGGDKTRNIVALRPTNIEEANKIPASQRKGLSLLTGFGFQSHDNGYIGINEDIGGHQTMAEARQNADKWAGLFFGAKGEYGDRQLVRRAKYDRMIALEERDRAGRPTAVPVELPGRPLLVFDAVEIRDSRNRPTVRAILRIDGTDLETTGDVPAGASTGGDEANTVGVPQAIKNILEKIAPKLSGLDLRKHEDLRKMEQLVIEAAGKNFKGLGADATVPVSWALWRMAAKLQGMELADYIQAFEPDAVADTKNPVYFYMNIFNGGLHALRPGEVLGVDRIDNQEIMIVPVNAKTYREARDIGDKIDFQLKQILSAEFAKGKIDRADEAGFSVKGLGSSTQAIGYVVQAIEKAGYKPGEDVKIALDTAATSFFKDGKYRFQGQDLDSDGMGAYYVELAHKYPGVIISFEDGLEENDWDGWKNHTSAMRALGIETIGDDLFVTQKPRFVRGIQEDAATAILIKVNQNGTISGTLEVIKWAKQYGKKWVVSHRSGETMDDGIADLAYATKALGLKTGDPQPQYDFAGGLPDYMDHITKLEPFLRPHTYNRNDEVDATRARLDSRFQRNPDLKGGEADPLLQKKGDYAFSNIKADVGSVPGHFKPHRVTIRSSEHFLELSKVYGFKGASQFMNLTRAITLLRTGYTIDELVSKNGLYRKSGSEAMMKKVNEFWQKTIITDWDEALDYIKAKTKDENLIALVMSLRDAQIDYNGFMIKVEAGSIADAKDYLVMSEEQVTPKQIEILSIMDGLTAQSAKKLFDTNETIRKVLGLTTDLTETEKILDFKVWAAGDDCQLTMKHKLLSEAKPIHTLAWDALWYAADQTSYFKPYGWKQDILVDRLVSGNIQGAGPGYAEVQVREGEDVLPFSADKSAPGAFTVPILGMTRKARAEGRFPNGLFYEVWDINKKPRAFFYSEFAQDMQDMLTLLSSPEEFAIKRVWPAKKKWDGKEPIENVIDDIPLLAASTERLVLTAGAYVGKDDPTKLLRISKGGFTIEEVIDIFQYPQVTLGFMRGSHVGPLVPGTQLSFFFGEDKEWKPEATPHLFDGPPPLAGLILAADKPLSEAKDVFETVPWLQDAIKQGNFITQVLRRQGWAPPHKVEGPDTEYTTWPEVMAAIEAEGRAKPASHAAEEQFMKSLLALQSKSISHKLSDAVLGVAKDAANKKVILVNASVLKNDPSLILALQSINEQINQTLGVFGNSANIEANAFQFVLIADDVGLRTAKDIDAFFAAIAKATNNGVVVNKDIFAKIITQEDMLEGRITNPEDLLKQLNRIMGISPNSIVSVVGSNKWTDRIRSSSGLRVSSETGEISRDFIDVNVDAQEGKVAFAGNALFAAVETVATADRKLPEPMAEKFDIVLLPSGAMQVKPEDVNKRVGDEIRTYRVTVPAI